MRKLLDMLVFATDAFATFALNVVVVAAAAVQPFFPPIQHGEHKLC